MSAITIDDDLVHFEALGRGRPVVLVHGWLGSWRYWVPAMRQLAGKYRTYAVDLWGFGDSARDTSRYHFDSQVALLEEFMDRMGIKKAALIGHDLGASVITRYAARHPDRVPRLMTVAPPVFWMTHQNLALTQNPLSQGGADNKPATPGKSDDASSGAGEAKEPVFTEAETVPWRTEDMKARIKAALERQAQTPGDTVSITGSNDAKPKSPREAATPPTDQPAKEIDTSAKAAPPTPEPLADVPSMPKLDYVPGETTMRIQTTNPLKEHLKTSDRFKLLEEHVDDNPDRKKLRDEIEKADPLAFAMTIDSFGLVDTLGDLRNLPMPLMVVYGDKDTFIQQPDKRMIDALEARKGMAKVMALEGMKHFPMLEEKAGFTRLLMEFLEASDVTQVKLTEIWERRVR